MMSSIIGVIAFIIVVIVAVFMGMIIGKNVTYTKGYSEGLKDGFERGYITCKEVISNFHRETLIELNHEEITPELSKYIVKMNKKIAFYEDSREENI